ncbi:ribonuclease D [Solirubrobacter sp. CPCC 204708]|uniref:Ribonuclease D n=1 Tax=Solirubrobacter deserti TaxID=2282478 RepID=A0ABT4RTX1_9ACTN|nr:ribonuclease D [Solirubrobacter deserti]MBE2317262.1 ribonuclease D [Solirubrobacter deserti]MDA0142029.1 ribonuclease D [Solirubrobacter deserti]
MQQTQTEVDRLADMAKAEGRLGLDTEFMPEGRYRPLLCLVQIVVGEHVEVLDPLTSTFNPAPLAAVLADPAIEIVLHAGRQDVAILRREWKTTFTNVFDTQVAAGFAGFSAQAGYNGLLHDVLRIRLPKTASFTRWDARPLTDEQIAYARGDVEHLMPLADNIQARLTERGRLDWAREECVAIAEATDERDPLEVWRRLPRVSGLDPRERAVAQAIAGWRERTAAAEDRPVGAVVRDPTVVELAKRQPSGRRDLAQIRGITPDVVRRRGDDLIAAIAAGKEAEPIQLEEGDRSPTEAVDGPTIALAESLVRSRAQEAGLAYELIAARADLSPIVVAARRNQPEPDVRTLRGWRRELVGEELLALLAGRYTLGVGHGGRVEIKPVG